MNAVDAKLELLENHYRHALQQLCDFYTKASDPEGLIDLRAFTESVINDAIERIRPARRLEQEVVSDPESGRLIR